MSPGSCTGGDKQWGRHWTKEWETEQSSDMYDAEMLYDRMPRWVATWVRDKDPSTPLETMH